MGKRRPAGAPLASGGHSPRGITMDNTEKLPERIRRYRQNLNMSQEELAEKSGVALSTIQAVEAGQAYPALGIFVKLSRALGQRLGTFMDDQFSPDPIITRIEDRDKALARHVASVSEGFTYYPLGAGKNDRHMEPFFVTIDADADAKFSTHEGEEFIIVVSGEVSLDYAGEHYVLKPGDSMYYNSIVSHKVAAANGQPATIYAVIFTPMD